MKRCAVILCAFSIMLTPLTSYAWSWPLSKIEGTKLTLPIQKITIKNDIQNKTADSITVTFKFIGKHTLNDKENFKYGTVTVHSIEPKQIAEFYAKQAINAHLPKPVVTYFTKVDDVCVHKIESNIHRDLRSVSRKLKKCSHETHFILSKKGWLYKAETQQEFIDRKQHEKDKRSHK